MKKTLLESLGQDNIEVFCISNYEGEIYRYKIEVGLFHLFLRGTENKENIFFEYPIVTTQLLNVPVDVNNDDELFQLIHSLIEISHYLEGKPPLSSSLTKKPLSSLPKEEPESFVKYFRNNGALIYENYKSFSSLGHDEYLYQEDKDFVVFYQDTEGYIRSSQVNDDEINTYKEQPDFHIFPNAKHILFKRYHIHIGQVETSISYAIANGDRILPSLPITVSLKDTNEKMVFSNLSDLLIYTEALFSKQETITTSTGLSLHANSLLLALGENSLLNHFHSTERILREELVPPSNVLDVDKFISFAEQHNMMVKDISQYKHSSHFLIGSYPRTLHFKFNIVPSEHGDLPLVQFPLLIEQPFSDSYINRWSELFDFIEQGVVEYKGVFESEPDKHNTLKENEHSVYTFAKEEPISNWDDDLPY